MLPQHTRTRRTTSYSRRPPSGRRSSDKDEPAGSLFEDDDDETSLEQGAVEGDPSPTPLSVTLVHPSDQLSEDVCGLIKDAAGIVSDVRR